MSEPYRRLSPTEALRYCRYLEEREPLRLADLAWWMHDSGGDVRAVTATLDGADVLWSWFVSFYDAQLPGVPHGVQPANSLLRADVGGSELAFPPNPSTARLMYAEESFWPFIRLLRENYQGVGRWAPTAGPRSYDFQRPVLLGSDWADFCNVAVGRLLNDAPKERNYRHLTSSLTFRDPRLASRVPASAEPVLVAFLSQPRPALDDPRRWPPRFGYRPEPKDPMEKFLDPEVSVEEFGIVSTATTDVSDEAVMAPLDADTVARGLADFGFTTSERLPATAEQLRAGDVELANTAGFAQVETIAHGGELKAVWVEPIYPDHRGWKRLMPRFTRLARKLDARIYRDSEA